MRIDVAGENSLILYFGDTTAPEISANVQLASRKLAAALGDKLIDQVTSYASLLLIFDPLKCDHLSVRKVIREQLGDMLLFFTVLVSRSFHKRLE